MNEYYLKARLFPTILSSIPIIIFVVKILSPLYSESLENINEHLPIIADASFSTALVFLGVQINRLVSISISYNSIWGKSK